MGNDQKRTSEDSKPAGITGNEPKPLDPPRRKRKTRTKPAPGPGTETPINQTGRIEIETDPEDIVSGIGIKQTVTGKQPPPPDFMLDAADKVLAENAQNALSAAVVLVAILDGFAVMLWGENAKMNPTENGMITPPLERILGRLGPGINNYVSAWGDPIMLLMGLIAWGSRVSRLNRLNAPAPQPEPEPETKENTAPRPSNNRPPIVDIGAATSAPKNIYDGFFGEGS
jgi:hypothetical protein